MRVADLEGNTSEWKLKGSIVTIDKRSRSKGHIDARKLLQEIFPTSTILEEVSIRIHPRTVLHLDFYLPLYKMAVEVHGEQHFKFTPHFHRDIMSFCHSKRNDMEKVEWCELNNITLTALVYNEDENEWRRKLQSE